MTVHNIKSNISSLINKTLCTKIRINKLIQNYKNKTLQDKQHNYKVKKHSTHIQPMTTIKDINTLKSTKLLRNPIVTFTYHITNRRNEH